MPTRIAGPDPTRTGKRKRKVTGEDGELRKTARFDPPENETNTNEYSPWNNLDLVLSLQDKNTEITKKVDLAYDYVKLSDREKMDDTGQCLQVLNTSRTIVFLSNWVQSVLISSEKKIRFQEYKPDCDVSGSFLDIKCWKILQFCLKESENTKLRLTFAKDFLRVINCIVMDASSCIKDISLNAEKSFSTTRTELYDVVLGCISLILSSHGGVANANLDLWILLMNGVLDNVIKVVMGKLHETELVNFVMQLSCYLLEPFAKFLRLHPTRKSGFHDFIDKLLEPMLQLLHLLNSSSHVCHAELKTTLIKLIEEVLGQGLFHPTHIDGFLSLQGTSKYKNSSDVVVKEEKSVNRSYHRHLFDVVEKIIAKKNGLALVGLGELLHLFVICAMKHKEASPSAGDSNSHVLNDSSLRRTIVSEIDVGFRHADAESRKCIFDFFVHIMEYLLIDVKKYLTNGEVVSVLSNIPITVRSINSLLAIYARDKLYLRTEDTSEGACRNFLQAVFDVFTSLSQKISDQHISSSGSDEELFRENFISVRLEVIAGVHHLLDIEYEVFGSDLESIWSILFTSMACFYGSVDLLGQHLLFSQIIRLSCRMIDLYSELRQVKSCIFALCRAVRNSMSYLLDSEECSPSHCSSYLNSLSTLICSLDFRSSLSNAAMAIPEGQVAECIRQLNSDVIESLEWIKLGHQLTDIEKSSKLNPQSLDSQIFNLQEELLGRVLSEVYTVLLKSTIVSCGNSYLVGVALKSLMDTLKPIVSNLVSPQQPNKNISVLVGGRVLSNSIGCGNLPMYWISVFSFQLLCYCRFFVRGAICLMPSDTSVKMSNVLGDSFTAFSGNELLEMAESADKGNIPWIPPPAETLTVLHSISDLCIQDSVVTFAPLVYISNVMAIQRLNDLNRLLKSLQFHQDLLRVKLEDDEDSLGYHRKRISRLRKEASGLTKYIMVCLSTIAKKLISAASDDGTVDDDLIIQHHNSDGIDIYVGPMDEKLLPWALWCIVCRNADVWFPHASKKDLNKFLKLLIQAFCISLGDQDGDFRVQSSGEVHYLKELARKFLNDMKLYDQQFLVRHMAPRICRTLQKSVTSLFPDIGVDLSETPDWVEVISALKNLSNVEIGSRPVMSTKSCNERKANAKIKSCKHLISLFMGLPKEFVAVGSKSLSINYILNFERVLLGSLLGWYGASCSHIGYFEIFRLFHNCRSVLRILTASFCETNANWSQCPLASKLQDWSFLSWLLESLYAFIRLKHASPGDDIPEEINTVFSMINSTSDMWLTISRSQCERAMSFNLFDGMQNGEREDFDPCNEESDISEHNLQLNSQGDLKMLQSVLVLAETLKDDMQNSVSTLQNVFLDSEKEGLPGHQWFNKLSSMVACFHGLFSGIASSLRDGDEISKSLRTSFLSNNPDLVNRINLCMDAFVKFAAFFMNEYFLDDDSTLGLPLCGDSSCGTKESPFNGFDDASNQDWTPPDGNSSPSEMKGYHKKRIHKRKCHSAISELESLVTNGQHKKRREKALLLQVIKGENAEAAFFLHHLFIAFSVALRMSLHIPFSTTLRSLYPDLVDISRFLLLEFSRSVTPLQSGYFWLNGVVKFLQELGRYFPKFDPSVSRELYVDLINLHIGAIGKCILLLEKNARLDSQWTGSTMVSANETKSWPHSITGQLVEFHRTLRSSFRTYIMEPSNLQLRSSLQAVERALVGLHQGSMTNYEIICGYSNDGGHVSLSVAGAIDCLALILEDVKGHQRLKMIKKNIHSFVACLFNIILHLQGPDIFCVYVDSVNYSTHPDSGSVILMCVEVLTRIYGKASHFSIDESHIVQSLRVPGALFQYFLQLQISEGSIKDASVITSSSSSVDWKLSLELYNACCCLLCTALKHHKSKTSQFMALLENSVGVLLHRLEIVTTNPVSRKDEVRNALTCANSLRRVYEELRQQKDVFAQYAYQFLSRYIQVYCGFGPAKKGIIREIDDTLKPGVYALLDICSADDLQLLHTMFGEGPCRRTLGALQHDYKVNFQFQGKI